MKTFEIGYKMYYHETSEWGVELVNARTIQNALKTFLRKGSIKDKNLSQAPNWKWWEGDWYYAFRYSKEVKVVSCPHCSGTGVISVYEELSKV
ncbi:MAG: hypothetical protein HY707_04245 [Ignavibacteriae bacterium]|nr:hypothetical protein [Ignavibacteriota bacterium]